MLTPSVPRFSAPEATATENTRGSAILWLTGPAVDLPRRLKRIEGLLPSLVVASHTPADGDALSGQTLELIANLIEHRKVRVILVCGHADDVTVRTQHEVRPRAHGFDSILQRVGDRAARRQRAQARVCAQLDLIQSQERVALALARGEVSIHGVFYASECDAFLVYDPARDQFVSVSEMSPA